MEYMFRLATTLLHWLTFHEPNPYDTPLSYFSCQCVTTCNHQHWKRVTCQNSNLKLFSISSMLFQKTSCKRMRHKSFTRENGGITRSQNYGSSKQRRQKRGQLLITMVLLVCNISTSISTHGRGGFMEMWTKTLLEDSCRRMMCGWNFLVHNMYAILTMA